MPTRKIEGDPRSVGLFEEAASEGVETADPQEVKQVDARLDELLERVAHGPVAATEETPERRPEPAQPPVGARLAGVAMRTATVVWTRGRQARLRDRATSGDVEAELAPGVSRELIEQAVRTGDAVLVECPAGETPTVVGVLQTRMPREVTIKASKVHIDAERELLLRAGRSAMRLRQDGDVEIVGSRIAAMSRGLFRLVGRVLRLN